MKDRILPGAEKIRLGSIRRRPLSVTQGGLVTVEPQKGESGLPLVMRPSIEGVDLTAWALSNREPITANLLKHGGILFRNFNVSSPELFEQFVIACSAEPLPYCERSSPRTRVNNNIYTSTDYPANQSIFLHNENSYQRAWPMKIFFCCLLPAAQGGETPIADCRRVFERIDRKVRRRFIEKGWMLVRNFDHGLSLSWQSVFQTEDQSAVEAYCREAGIETEWRKGGLRTRQVRQAVAQHPGTGEMIWFNHAAFFHISTLEPSTREALMAGLREEDLPNNTYYGDGAPIEISVIEEIREAYRRETVSFVWQEGDILMLDNMLVAHGRNPYIGQRKVLVAMAEQFGPIATNISLKEGNVDASGSAERL
jgi:alpha-ketoglutarate-dependent taurine dioxygenase